MDTINISLPSRLKDKAKALVTVGLYASFSDLVRDSIRQTIAKTEYDLWAQSAKKDLKEGKAKVLKSSRDIDRYLKSL